MFWAVVHLLASEFRVFSNFMENVTHICWEGYFFHLNLIKLNVWDLKASSISNQAHLFLWRLSWRVVFYAFFGEEWRKILDMKLKRKIYSFSQSISFSAAVIDFFHFPSACRRKREDFDAHKNCFFSLLTNIFLKTFFEHFLRR